MRPPCALLTALLPALICLTACSGRQPAGEDREALPAASQPAAVPPAQVPASMPETQPDATTPSAAADEADASLPAETAARDADLYRTSQVDLPPPEAPVLP